MRLILPAIFLLAATGCDSYLVVNVSSQAVCYTESDIEIPAAAANGLALVPVQQEPIDLGLGDAFATEGRLLGLTLRPSSVIDDLGFIQELSVEVRAVDPEARLPRLEIVSYSRPTNTSSAGYHPPVSELFLPGDPHINIAEYFNAGAVDYIFAFGPAPQVEWTLDVEACFDLTVHYER